MINLECPECCGKIKIKKVTYLYRNQINLGEFEAEVCEKCKATYFTEKSFKEIQVRAKLLGLWGREIMPSEKRKVTISARRMPIIDADVIFRKNPYHPFKSDMSVSVI